MNTSKPSHISLSQIQDTSLQSAGAQRESWVLQGVHGRAMDPSMSHMGMGKWTKWVIVFPSRGQKPDKDLAG